MTTSANIVCSNESYWIQASIESIIDFVDEIIIVDDQSFDNSLEIAKSFISSKIKIFDYSKHNLRNLGDLKNFAVEKSTSTHILRWDADFVAYDSIQEILEFIHKNEKQYDVMQLSGPNLAGSTDFCSKNRPRFGPEIYLSKKYSIQFSANERYSDMPIHPSSTKICRLHEYKYGNYFFHGNTLKPIEKLAMRARMTEWNRSRTKLSYWEWLAGKEQSTPSKIKEQLIDRINNTPIELTPYIDFKLPIIPQKLNGIKKIMENFNISNINGKFFLNYPRYIND